MGVDGLFLSHLYLGEHKELSFNLYCNVNWCISMLVLSRQVIKDNIINSISSQMPLKDVSN